MQLSLSSKIIVQIIQLKHVSINSWILLMILFQWKDNVLSKKMENDLDISKIF